MCASCWTPGPTPTSQTGCVQLHIAPPLTCPAPSPDPDPDPDTQPSPTPPRQHRALSRPQAGQTALWCACRGGHAGAVQALLAAGAALAPKAVRGERPITIRNLPPAIRDGRCRGWMPTRNSCVHLGAVCLCHGNAIGMPVGRRQPCLCATTMLPARPRLPCACTCICPCAMRAVSFAAALCLLSAQGGPSALVQAAGSSGSAACVEALLAAGASVGEEEEQEEEEEEPPGAPSIRSVVGRWRGG